MKVLSLFSGGGLGDFGLTLAKMEIVGQVEIDEYCQKILNLRWPDVPKWRDIRSVTGKEIIERCGSVDLVCGGFPCQPFSVAGKRKGAADDRNLWPEMFRVIKEVSPRFVLAENVPGVLGYVESVVLPDLESIDYEVLPPLVFPAHALGADHWRFRVWIIAHAASEGRRVSEIQRPASSHSSEPCDDCEIVANATRDSKRWSRKASGKQSCKAGGRSSQSQKDLADAPVVCEREPANEADALSGGWQARQESSGGSWWTTEPNVGRVAHGVANRVDRLKLLGNGQVVQVAKWIGKRIMEFDRSQETKI